MKFFVFFLLMLVTSACHADGLFREGEDWIRITALPCKDDTVIRLLKEDKEDPLDYRAAQSFVGGKLYQSCWKPMNFMHQVAVVLRHDDGDHGVLPIGRFTVVP